MLFCHLLIFFIKINFFKKFSRKHYQSVKQFGSRPGSTYCQSWSVLIWVQTDCKWQTVRANFFWEEMTEMPLFSNMCFNRKEFSWCHLKPSASLLHQHLTVSVKLITYKHDKEVQIELLYQFIFLVMIRPEASIVCLVKFVYLCTLSSPLAVICREKCKNDILAFLSEKYNIWYSW